METTAIDNHTLVKEEQLGYASHYHISHETTISDPTVREQIVRMALDEVVS